MPHYSKATQLRFKAQYESGKYGSLGELREKYGKRYHDRPPSMGTLDKWAREWDKGKDAPLIAEKIKESTTDMFARLGMPKERVLQTIIKGIAAPEIMMEAIEEYLKKKIAEGMKLDSVTIDLALKEAFDRTYGDLNTTHKFIQTYLDMTGDRAPKKTDVTSGGEKLEPGTAYYGQDLTDEELDLKLKQLMSRREKLSRASNG